MDRQQGQLGGKLALTKFKSSLSAESYLSATVHDAIEMTLDIPFQFYS